MFKNIDFDNKPINSMVIIFGYAAVFFALVFALRLIFMPANVAMGLAEKTFNPDAIIYNYEWFKTQYNDIKSFDVRIKNAEESLTSFNESYKGIQRDKWPFEATQRETELNSILLGLKNQRALMVAEYNARAKMANRNFVKFDDVPEYIEQ